MSNDLIRRNDAIELIESKLTDGYLLIGGDKPMVDAAEIIEDISDLPTAYDVDKVVEQLHNAGGCDGSCDYDKGWDDAIEEAERILKAGMKG